jgi:hypothetical protein
MRWGKAISFASAAPLLGPSIEWGRLRWLETRGSIWCNGNCDGNRNGNGNGKNNRNRNRKGNI